MAGAAAVSGRTFANYRLINSHFKIESIIQLLYCARVSHGYTDTQSSCYTIIILFIICLYVADSESLIETSRRPERCGITNDGAEMWRLCKAYENPKLYEFVHAAKIVQQLLFCSHCLIIRSDSCRSFFQIFVRLPIVLTLIV